MTNNDNEKQQDERSGEASKFVWFDLNKDNIKDKDKLTAEQLDYIRSWSVTIFGPLNTIIRKHWDLFSFSLVLSISMLIMENRDIASGWMGFLYLTAIVYFFYVAVRHGRRLAWNRNDWEDIEHFKRSEKKWIVATLLLFVFALATNFF